MTTHKHYVPILKGKEAEFSSLGTLSSSDKQGLTPLIEIPPTPWDFNTDTYSKEPSAHLNSVVDKINKNWGTQDPIFIELLLMDPEILNTGMHSIQETFDLLRQYGVQSIPVTGLSRSADYQQAVQGILRTDTHGLCLRVQARDVSGNIGNDVQSLLRRLSIHESEVDLVVDLGYMLPAQMATLSLSIPPVFNEIGQIGSWRTVTLCGGSFPESMASFDQDSVTKIPRTEWKIWTNIVQTNALLRLPWFGDYPIANPELMDEIDPRLMKMSVNLRYTLDKEWLVLKARNARNFGFDQFLDLCKKLRSMPEYYGPAFSWGDDYINRGANGTATSGNPTTWRKVGVTHHLAVVIDQMAGLP